MNTSTPSRLAFLYPPLWLDPNATHTAMMNPLLPISPTSPIHKMTDTILAILLCDLIYLIVNIVDGYLARFPASPVPTRQDRRRSNRQADFNFIGSSLVVLGVYIVAIWWILLLGLGEGALGQYTSALFVASSALHCGVYLAILVHVETATWVMKQKLARLLEEREALRETDKTD